MALRKKILISTTILTSAVIIILTGFFITYHIAKISYDKTIKGDVQSDIIITRTDKGIPLIAVSNNDDIFFALGYIHAQDRLNLMEYQRALATGTVSHFISNPDSELLDRLSSIIGFTLEADVLYNKLDPDIKNQITCYTNGVNHIRHTRHLAKTGKYDWTPADVLSILIMKEWTESFLSNTELFFSFNELKRKELTRLFSSIEKFYYYSDEDTRYLYILQRIKTLIETYIGHFNQGFAAYIHPSLNMTDNRNLSVFSYTGSFNVYPGWYPVNIQTDKTSISAITFNGLPFFFTFKKDSSIFTHFSINADTQNFSLFKTRKNNNTYQYNITGSWKDFKPVRIPEGGDRSLNTLRWITDKGPILSDLISSDKETDRILCIDSVYPGQNYIKILMTAPFENDSVKLKNLLLSSDAALKGFLIKTEKDIQKIFSGFVTPPVTGNYILTDGSVLKRAEFQKISIAKNITTTDYIGSDLTSFKDIHSLQNGVFTTNTLKLRKLTELLTPKKIFTEESVQDITTNTYSEAAEMFLPVFRQILDSTPLTSAKMTKIYFNDWDLSTRQKLQAPAIFYTTLNNMINDTFRDELGNDTDSFLKYSYLLYDDFHEILNKNTSFVFDNIITDQIETRESIFDRAFLNSMRSLGRKTGPLMENWAWGELTKTFFKIPNITSSIYTRFYRINETPVNGAPDSLYYLSFSQDYKPVDATVLTGFISDNSFKFKMNYAYSSSIFSDFYYGKISKVHSDSSSGNEVSYKTVINPL